MQVLVTGAGGLLGSNVVSLAIGAGHQVTGTYHTRRPEHSVPGRRLDIRDADAFRSTVDNLELDVVVNCAAMTDVDACESDPDRANEVNGRAPGELAAVCAARGIAFVHVSTDYVFAGETESKYVEVDEPNPIQAYGRSKLLGERRVRERLSTPLIVRPSFVYGTHGVSGELRGFPAWFISRLGGGEDVPLFVDQRVTPSRAGQVARTVLELVAAGADGTYHVACRDCVSPYEFGQAICRQVGADESLLTVATMDDASRPAPRPTNTCLHVARIEERLDRPQPDLGGDLYAIRDALMAGVK